MTDDKAAAFAGTLAEFCDRYLVPLSFAPYAEIVADRAKGLRPRHVLETAAGTGAVTEALSRTLPSDVAITATDLNLPMIERGKVRPGSVTDRSKGRRRRCSSRPKDRGENRCQRAGWVERFAKPIAVTHSTMGYRQRSTLPACCQCCFPG
jgi:hypothetical protein